MATVAAPSPVSAALFEFVEKVWTLNATAPIQSARDVYNVYGESNLQRATLTWEMVEDFADVLLELQRIGGANCDLVWQTDETRGDKGWIKDQTEITSAFTTMKAEATSRAAPVSPISEGLLFDDFVHFSNKQGTGKTTERIYIHLTPPIPENGLEVMGALLDMFPAHPGLKSAKICAACATDRVDNIVVYLSSSAAADWVVHALSHDPALGGCFERGVPLVVTEVTQGIGRAQEPPVTAPLYAADGVAKHRLRKSPQVDPKVQGHGGSFRFETASTSFGALHAELIYTGLRQWRAKNAGASLTDPVPLSLLTEIAAVYAQRRYDPMNPTQFVNRRRIETEFQRKMSAKFFSTPIDPARIGQHKTV